MAKISRKLLVVCLRSFRTFWFCRAAPVAGEASWIPANHLKYFMTIIVSLPLVFIQANDRWLVTLRNCIVKLRKPGLCLDPAHHNEKEEWARLSLSGKALERWGSQSYSPNLARTMMPEPQTSRPKPTFTKWKASSWKNSSASFVLWGRCSRILGVEFQGRDSKSDSAHFGWSCVSSKLMPGLPAWHRLHIKASLCLPFANVW